MKVLKSFQADDVYSLTNMVNDFFVDTTAKIDSVQFTSISQSDSRDWANHQPMHQCFVVLDIPLDDSTESKGYY